MEVRKIEVYNYDELSEDAQEKARNWYREGDNDFWSEYTIKDAKTIGALMGIDIDKIYYSGFWSQGDGACFEGRYSYKAGSVKAVKEYAPLDEELHRIAEGLREVQRRHFYHLEARVKHSGHYYHEMCTEIEVYDERDQYSERATNEAEEGITEFLRDFMRWIYKSLEADYEAENSDETVAENIRANKYTFTEDGNRF